MYLVIDCETNGLPAFRTSGPRYFDPSELDKYDSARVVQLAWALYDDDGKRLSICNFVTKADDFEIPEEVVRIHGITKEMCGINGVSMAELIGELEGDLRQVDRICGYSVQFDVMVLRSEFIRAGRVDLSDFLSSLVMVDVRDLVLDLVDLDWSGGERRTLWNVYRKMFNHSMEAVHDACVDVESTNELLRAVLNRNLISWDEIPGKSWRRLGFGKYKGKNFEELAQEDVGYCDWVVKQVQERGGSDGLVEFADYLMARAS